MDPTGYHLDDITKASLMMEKYEILEFPTLPVVIQTMDRYQDFRIAGRITSLNTGTSEYRDIIEIKKPSGQTVKEGRSTAVHGALEIADWEYLEYSNKHISHSFEYSGIESPVNDYDVFCTKRAVWEEMDIPEIHVSELRRGAVPPLGTPWRVVAYDGDNPDLSSEGMISLDEAGENDRMLMLAGSRYNLELLIGIYRDEGLTSIYNRCHVAEIGRDTEYLEALGVPIMQPVALGNGNEGLTGVLKSGRIPLLRNNKDAYQETYVLDSELVQP